MWKRIRNLRLLFLGVAVLGVVASTNPPPKYVQAPPSVPLAVVASTNWVDVPSTAFKATSNAFVSAEITKSIFPALTDANSYMITNIECLVYLTLNIKGEIITNTLPCFSQTHVQWMKAHTPFNTGTNFQLMKKITLIKAK